jgi:hypothetical protein
MRRNGLPLAAAMAETVAVDGVKTGIRQMSAAIRRPSGGIV